MDLGFELACFSETASWQPIWQPMDLTVGRARQSVMARCSAVTWGDLSPAEPSRAGQTPPEHVELHDAQGVGGSTPSSPTPVDLRKPPQVNCAFPAAR